jgi:CDP-diglyceride synthetase
VFWLVELFVILCLDLVFIRTILGPLRWSQWRNFWGENKTHWTLAILNTVVCTLVFGFLLLMSFFSDNMSDREIHKAGLFGLPALALFCAFAFFHSIFRDRLTVRPGALAGGCFLLLLLVLGLWKWT